MFFMHIICAAFALFAGFFPLPPQSLPSRLRTGWLLGQLVRSTFFLMQPARRGPPPAAGATNGSKGRRRGDVRRRRGRGFA